jgi:hypothetical protein
MVTNGGCSCARELRRTSEGELAYRTILHLRGIIYTERSSKNEQLNITQARLQECQEELQRLWIGMRMISR